MFAFFVPFFDWRRPFRLLHLDLLVLLAFSLSHVFFNSGEISTSVPLVYPVLGYLLVRMLLVAFRAAAPSRASAAPPARPGHLARAGADLPGRLSRRPERHQLERDRRRLLGGDRGRPHHARRATLRKLPRRQPRPATPTGRSTTTPTSRSSWPFPGRANGTTCRPRTPPRSSSTWRRSSRCSSSGGGFAAGRDGNDAGRRCSRTAWAAYPYTLFVLELERQRLARRAAGRAVRSLALSAPRARGALLALAARRSSRPLALVPLFAGYTATKPTGRATASPLSRFALSSRSRSLVCCRSSRRRPARSFGIARSGSSSAATRPSASGASSTRSAASRIVVESGWRSLSPCSCVRPATRSPRSSWRRSARRC